MNAEERVVILNRLWSIEGRLQAIIGMVKAEKPCEQVLHQMQAVEAALCAATRVLRGCEFRHSADILLHNPNRADSGRTDLN
jgi:DNA-binding FrmR family transcriptional regulator